MSDFDSNGMGAGASAPNRQGVAVLHRQVATVKDFEVVAKSRSAIDQWLSQNYGPTDYAQATEELRSYRKPFGRGARVISGMGRKSELLWIVRQNGTGEWETVWPR